MTVPFLLFVWLIILIVLVLCITIPAKINLWKDKDVFGVVLMSVANGSLLFLLGIFIIDTLQSFNLL